MILQYIDLSLSLSLALSLSLPSLSLSFSLSLSLCLSLCLSLSLSLSLHRHIILYIYIYINLLILIYIYNNIYIIIYIHICIYCNCAGFTPMAGSLIHPVSALLGAMGSTAWRPAPRRWGWSKHPATGCAPPPLPELRIAGLSENWLSTAKILLIFSSWNPSHMKINITGLEVRIYGTQQSPHINGVVNC